jgi:hypothetical protein
MRTRRCTGLLLLLALLASASLQAQPGPASIAGTVVDGDTGQPLEGVHVFIAASMIGAATDAAGRYHLEHVPVGAHTLYVSMLGFEPARHPFQAAAGGAYRHDFRLTPVVLEAPEVTVTAARDKKWQKRLDKFTRLFLGETPNAAHMQITNPEVLDFDATWWGKLTARASAPLVITNRALGYQVRYFLKEFTSDGATIKYDGEPLFEPLERLHAYRGSFRQFMLALLADELEAAGFRAYHLPGADNPHRAQVRFPVRPEKVLSDGPGPDDRTLSFHGFIEVVYEREAESEAFLRWQQADRWRPADAQRSWIELTDGPTVVDPTGEVVDPYGVTVYGYFAFERVADLLPKEYRP